MSDELQLPQSLASAGDAAGDPVEESGGVEPDDWADRLRSYRDAIRRPDYPDLLRRAYAAYDEPVRFAPGDIVEWKTLLRNRPFPAYGAPVVVVRYIEVGGPRVSDSDSDVEPDDIILGMLTGENEFLALPFVSRRFQVWRGRTADLS